jgi:hypothetical protein
MLTSDKAAAVHLYLVYLLQEQPFGLVVNFAEETKPLLDINIMNLTEEQADTLIADCVGQWQRFFDSEGTEEAAPYEEGDFDDSETAAHEIRRGDVC